MIIITVKSIFNNNIFYYILAIISSNAKSVYDIMEQKAIEYHIQLLYLMKDFFKYIKYEDNSNEIKYIDLSISLNDIFNYKEKCFIKYQKILKDYPNLNVYVHLNNLIF